MGALLALLLHSGGCYLSHERDLPPDPGDAGCLPVVVTVDGGMATAPEEVDLW